MTRTPAPDAIYPTKSQPFSIIWEDSTDSVVDLRRLLQFARNFELGLHKPSTDPPPTSNGARAPGTVVSMELQPPLLPPLSPPTLVSMVVERLRARQR